MHQEAEVALKDLGCTCAQHAYACTASLPTLAVVEAHRPLNGACNLKRNAPARCTRALLCSRPPTRPLPPRNKTERGNPVLLRYIPGHQTIPWAFLMALREKWTADTPAPNKDHQWCTKESLIRHADKYTKSHLEEVGVAVICSCRCI